MIINKKNLPLAQYLNETGFCFKEMNDSLASIGVEKIQMTQSFFWFLQNIQMKKEQKHYSYNS